MRLSRSRRILFAAMTLVLALAGIEGIARVAEPRIVPSQRDLPLPAPMTPTQTGGDAWRRLTQAQRGAVPMREDERTGWSLPPSSVRMDGDLWIRVNALGLRGPEAGPKVEGEQRLLSLGDSSIFGVGVEEKYLFTTAAAEVLAESWKRTVTPFVGGVPGYSSTQALENLRRVGGALQPDWVIIGCIWSDLYQNQDMATARRRQQIREPMRAFATWRVLRWWLSPWLASQKVRWVDGKQDIGTLDDEGYPPRTSLADYLKNLRGIVAEATKLGGRPAFWFCPLHWILTAFLLPKPYACTGRHCSRWPPRAGHPFWMGPPSSSRGPTCPSSPIRSIPTGRDTSFWARPWASCCPLRHLSRRFRRPHEWYC